MKNPCDLRLLGAATIPELPSVLLQTPRTPRETTALLDECEAIECRLSAREWHDAPTMCTQVRARVGCPLFIQYAYSCRFFLRMQQQQTEDTQCAFCSKLANSKPSEAEWTEHWAYVLQGTRTLAADIERMVSTFFVHTCAFAERACCAERVLCSWGAGRRDEQAHCAQAYGECMSRSEHACAPRVTRGSQKRRCSGCLCSSSANSLRRRYRAGSCRSGGGTLPMPCVAPRPKTRSERARKRASRRTKSTRQVLLCTRTAAALCARRRGICAVSLAMPATRAPRHADFFLRVCTQTRCEGEVGVPWCVIFCVFVRTRVCMCVHCVSQGGCMKQASFRRRRTDGCRQRPTPATVVLLAA